MPRQRRFEKYRNSIIAPRYQSASYYFGTEAEVVAGLHRKSVPYGRYGRYDNPSWLLTEDHLREICHADDCAIFSSGMAAHATTFLALLGSGSTMAMQAEAYRQTRKLCFTLLKKGGVAVLEDSIRDPERFLRFLNVHRDSIDLVHLEMPSSPHMYVLDLDKIRSSLRSDTVITMDCSFSPPPNFFPHDYGVDLALYSGTKYLGGHGDIVIGAITGRTELVRRIREVRDTIGTITDGSTAELLERSLHTLDARLNVANAMGLGLAKFLQGRTYVSNVYYTGLSSHPHYSLAQKYLKGHGGVVTFQLEGGESEVAKFVDLLSIPFMASNFGCHVSLVEQSTFFTYYEYSDEELQQISVPRNTVRYSTGYSDNLDAICNDIGLALENYLR